MGPFAPWQSRACLDVLLSIQHPPTALVLLGCSGFEIGGQRHGSISARKKRLGTWKAMWHHTSSNCAAQGSGGLGHCRLEDAPGLLKDTFFSN